MTVTVGIRGERRLRLRDRAAPVRRLNVHLDASALAKLALRCRPSEAHGLRALDAIHLAGAVTLPGTVLVSWDERLRQAALAAGLAVAP